MALASLCIPQQQDEAMSVNNNHEQLFQSLSSSYPALGSMAWYYTLFIFIWMNFVSYSIIQGPAGFNAWATFTCWTWTMITLRHALILIHPLLNNDADNENNNNKLLSWWQWSCIYALEYSKFPTMIMAIVTFVVWNFILMPLIYFFFMPNDERRQRFLIYFFKWRLVQVHIFHLLYAYINVYQMGSRRRRPWEWRTDFVLGVVVAVLYLWWYTLVLDRIGAHLYPIFSPRSPWAVLTWTTILGILALGFHWLKQQQEQEKGDWPMSLFWKLLTQ